MPPKLKRLPPKPTQTPAPAAEEDDLTVGNIRVGPDGVEFTGEGDFHVPRPDLNIDSLKRVRQLGKGTQGNVSMYKTVDDTSVFAVKKIVIPCTADSRLRQTVAAELRNIFSEKSNEYTVQLYNAFYRHGALRLVMEYMDWGNLEELLAIPDLKVPESVCAFITSQMLHALEILHTKSNIVTEPNPNKTVKQIHRDIKPANVLLSTDGVAKLADFGIATSAETIGVNSFVGTATYMSPERIQGRRYSTPSDIWSVGVVVAQVLLGQYPFMSVEKGFMALLREITAVESLPLQERTGCSAEAQAFIDKCLKQSPDDRATATELLQCPWIVQNREVGQQAMVALLKTIGDSNRQMNGTNAWPTMNCSMLSAETKPNSIVLPLPPDEEQ
ncbi:mitogen-activated protein kinase kinase 1 [Strigomonas culicis]|uniref:mitogen-activated protein kinase kinase n=1 Tax=Strigomonas culicis TaxID=28005 RepID=S9W905_9TRYP|nr:mitogen-activated protein kinase kinase 1 [Strigomonas culicis]|eukprot:EPY35736.1 mitogen-activated protein kinase kinase 1 [Strigomonas culicis]